MMESSIEKKVCEFAKRHGVLSVKLAGPNDRGKPDRMFLYNGRVVFIEFKAPGKKPTPLQERWIDTLRALGFSANYVDNAGDGIILVRELIDKS